MALIRTAITADNPKYLLAINSLRLIGLEINTKIVRFSISLLTNPVPINIATIKPMTFIVAKPKSKNILSDVVVANSGIARKAILRMIA